MALRVIQGVYIAAFIFLSVVFLRGYKKNRENDMTSKQVAGNLILNFVTNGLDALGIGSFATTIAGMKMFKLLDDKKIVPTLNAGCCMVVFVEAVIFLQSIEVEIPTLVCMIAASILGGVIGVGFAKKLPEKTLRIILGIALIIAAFFIVASVKGWMPGGGNDVGLHGWKLAVGCIGNFILGALLTVGIGNYAPCMAMIYLLGMNPAVAFPIMMCSGSLCCFGSGLRFIKEGMVHWRGMLYIVIGGIPGVLIASFVIKSMPLGVLNWLVVVVLIYTAVTLFRDASKMTETNLG